MDRIPFANQARRHSPDSMDCCRGFFYSPKHTKNFKPRSNRFSHLWHGMPAFYLTRKDAVCGSGFAWV